MPRITKAMLEEQNNYLRRKINELSTEVHYLTKEIELRKQFNRPTEALTIALERVTDSTAHVMDRLAQIELREVTKR